MPVKTILDMSKKVGHWQESMSKQFCRNFACRNNSHTFARIPVGNILDPILCSKFFCRNYSAKELRNVRFFYNVEIIPGIRTRLLNIFDCRKNSVFLIWSTRKFSNVENILHSKCWFTRWGISSNLLEGGGISSKLVQNFFDTHFRCRNFSVEVYTVEKITPCTVENILSREKTCVEKILS